MEPYLSVTEAVDNISLAEQASKTAPDFHLFITKFSNFSGRSQRLPDTLQCTFLFHLSSFIARCFSYRLWETS